jgi:1-acyl-sn-glycerol-3-phosphate acyltransferase
MIGKIGTALVLAFVAVSTAGLAVAQVVALKTGIGNPYLFPRLWHRCVLKALGFRVRMAGAPSSHRPLLIAANHVSWTDIGVLGSLLDVSFIAKSEMEGWPLMGWLSTLQRTVFVERERRHRSGDQASEIAMRLKAGDAMVLFAEGTTGDGNILLPFKSTLFGAATMVIDKGASGGGDEVAIQPVAIAYARRHGMPLGRAGRMALSWVGDQDLVPHVAGLLKLGAVDVEVRFGEPVIFSAKSNRKEAARLVEARVRDMMRAALHGTGPAA